MPLGQARWIWFDSVIRNTLTGNQEPRKSDAPQLRDEYRTYKILVGYRKHTTLNIIRVSLEPFHF